MCLCFAPNSYSMYTAYLSNLCPLTLRSMSFKIHHSQELVSEAEQCVLGSSCSVDGIG